MFVCLSLYSTLDREGLFDDKYDNVVHITNVIQIIFNTALSICCRLCDIVYSKVKVNSYTPYLYLRAME